MSLSTKRLLCTAAVVGLMATPASAAIATDMCLGDFTTVDTNDDGIVSADEAKKAASSDFSRIDADGSGAVSMAEWRNCGLAARIGDQVGEGEIKDSAIGQTMAAKVQPLVAEGDFEAVDIDKSGDISREEAAQAAATSYDSLDTELTQEEYVRAYGARFSVLDTDGDGSLSINEWRDRDAFVSATFDELDANNDNQLSESEYLEARNVEPSGEPVSVWYYFLYY